MRSFLALGVAAAMAASASADVLIVDLTGWVADAGYGNPNNTNASYFFPVGTTIDDAEYVDLTIEALGSSWEADFTLSLNDSPAFVGGFWDTTLAGAANAPGVYGPVSDNFGTVGFGGPFTLTTGELYIETYDFFNDNPGLESQVVGSAGFLRITYTIPEPSSIALLGLGALGLLRRRG